MRWLLGNALLLGALLACAGSLIADPYNTLGVGPEYLRPGIAEICRNFALASLGLLAMACATVFGDAANRKGWRTIAFGIFAALVALICLARLAWLYLSVFA